MNRILIVPGSAVWSDAAREALAMGGFEVVAEATPGEAAEAAREQSIGVVADAAYGQLEELTALLRGAERTENLPILVVVRDPLRDDLERLFRLAIDDYLVADSVRQVRDRAVALSSGDPWSGLRAPSGRLVLAGENRGRRILIARILRRWGFDLSFASNRDELLAQVRQGSAPRAVIADGPLPPDDENGSLAAVRGEPRGRDVPWLFVVDAARREAARDAMQKHGRATVYSRGGPPENVIFALNDLLQPGAVEARRSPRLLHGAPVAFWTDGAPETIWAYSYNINRTGLYVRTLVPPPMGTVLHLRFRPPHGEGLVAADAQVMWRKELGATQGPMYPAGVGVQFVRLPLADEAALGAGYDRLLHEGELSGTVRPVSTGPGRDLRQTVRVTIDPSKMKAHE